MYLISSISKTRHDFFNDMKNISNVLRHQKIGINKIENPNCHSHCVSFSFINTLAFKAEKVSRLIDCTNFILTQEKWRKLLVIYGFYFHMCRKNKF